MIKFALVQIQNPNMMNLLKNLKSLTPLVAMIAFFGFMACDNEPVEGQFSNTPPVNDPVGGDEKFQVKLDSVLFVGKLITANLSNDGLEIVARADTQTVAIQIFNPIVDTFDLAKHEALVIYDPNKNKEDLAYSSNEGKLIITKIDSLAKTVSGTFSGNLMEWSGAKDIKMTGGIFENIEFTTNQDPDVGYATINGEEFTASTFPYTFANNQIHLILSNDLNEQIQLTLPLDVIPGTKSVNTPPSDYSGVYTDFVNGQDVSYYSIFDSGEITVTSYQNGRITGSFYFDAKDSNGTETVSITDGFFSIDID